MPMLEEVAARLAPFGTLTTNLFLGYMPDLPHSCIALYQLPGSPPDDTFAVLPYAENLILQVQVRDPNYSTAEATSRSVWLDLLEVIGIPLSSTHYYRISANQSPYLMERDDTRRCIFVCNYAVSRKIA